MNSPKISILRSKVILNQLQKVLHSYSISHVVNSNGANGKQNNYLHGMFAYSFEKNWEELLRRS